MGPGLDVQIQVCGALKKKLLHRKWSSLRLGVYLLQWAVPEALLQWMVPEALLRRVVPEVLLRQAVLEEPVVALRPLDDLAAVVLLRKAGAEGKDAERVEKCAAGDFQERRVLHEGDAAFRQAPVPVQELEDAVLVRGDAHLAPGQDAFVEGIVGVSHGSAGDYQEDEQAGVAQLRWRVSGR